MDAEMYQQLEKAKSDKNPALAAKLAVYLMAAGTDARYHLSVVLIYAWALEAQGQLEDALKYYQLLERLYKSNGKLTPPAAHMVVRQARVLKGLRKYAAADTLLRELRRRVDAELPSVFAKGVHSLITRAASS